MAEIRRRTPAIPDRSGEWLYQSQYIPLSEFQEPPPPANPVIPFRTRLLSELDVEPLPEGSYPRYLPFPYLDPSLFPASPVLPFRYGKDVLADLPAFVAPRFLPFPYFQEPPPTANPVVPFRYGQDVLTDTQAFVVPHYLPFPYFQEPPTPASPVPPYRYGKDVLADVPAFVAPRFLPFPYFQEPPPPPASPVIGFRYGQPLLDDPQLLIGPQRLPFPYFQESPAAANPVIAYRMCLLSELNEPELDVIFAVPKFYPWVSHIPLVLTKLSALSLLLTADLSKSIIWSGDTLPIAIVTSAPSDPPPGNKGVVFQVTGGVVTIHVWDGTAWRVA